MIKIKLSECEYMNSCPLRGTGGMKLIVFPNIPEIIPLREIILDIFAKPNIVDTNKYQGSI